mgnify:FL=1
MNINKLALVTSTLLNRIYLTEKIDDNLMSVDNRKDVTDEAVRTVAEHLMMSKSKAVAFEGYGTLKWLPEIRPKDFNKSKKIPRMVVTILDNKGQLYMVKSYSRTSLNSVLKEHERPSVNPISTVHEINRDGTHTLIWKGDTI